MDLALVNFVPTWDKGWDGLDGITKRLDMFLVEYLVVVVLDRFRAWSITSIISDHFPIC